MNNLLPKEINVGGLLYRVYESGRVYSVLRNRLMSVRINPKGYNRINLGPKNKQFNYLQHRLIAELFIPNPENKPQINHINGIKTDNRLENLEWCTAAENMKHAKDTGLIWHPKGQETHNSKLKNAHVFFIRSMINMGFNQSELANLFSINQSIVSRIKNKQNWQHV